MKSPLAERPIFHQVQRRVETQIFLCVLAQYLLVAIENTRLDQGVHTSWASVRDSLATHHIVTIVLPTDTGATLRIRKGSTPESEHQRTLSTARRQRTNRAAEEIWSETGASPVHPPQLRDFTRANEIIRQFSPILGIPKSPRNGLPSIVRPCIRERTGRHRHAGFQRDISQGRAHAADAGAVAWVELILSGNQVKLCHGDKEELVTIHNRLGTQVVRRPERLSVAEPVADDEAMNFNGADGQRSQRAKPTFGCCFRSSQRSAHGHRSGGKRTPDYSRSKDGAAGI